MRSWFRENADRLLWLSKMAAMETELARKRAVIDLLQKYSPDQPRVPGGNPDGGQWTSEGGEGTSNDGNDVGQSSTELSAAVSRRKIEDACDAQYRRDTFICNLVHTPLCWQRANARYAACIGGDPIPELRF